MNIRNRYQVLIIAAVVNFVHGNPYIWTVFQPYVKEEYGLSTASSSQPFMIIIGVFALGNMLGGFWQHKIGSRNTVLSGSLIMCLGFYMAALAPVQMPWMISAGYGLLGGVGSGCAFSMLVAVPQMWFPDKRGLVTGITIGVVGVSGIIMNPLCDYILAAHGYRYTMLMVASVYTVISFTGGWFILEPSGEKTGYPGGEKQEDGIRQYTTGEMFRTKTYYLLGISMALGVPAYVLVNPLMKSLGMERGLSADAALFGVLCASFANIIGRFLSPWLSDRTGCKKMIQILYVIAMCSVAGLTAAKGPVFILLISLISLTYGGFVSVYPVLTAELFGIKYQGMNFGAVMLGYGIVSVLCPYLMDAVEGTSYGTSLSFLIAGIVCIAGMAVTHRIQTHS